MTKNFILNNWIEEIKNHAKPDNVVMWTGEQEQYDTLAEELVNLGKAIRLNPEKRPRSLLFRSDPSDVARVEKRTFISTTYQEQAGPTNNWIAKEELMPLMWSLYEGSMKGRTMYVIPFSMGPVGLEMSRIGVEITDSPYVALNMHIMTRTGNRVIELIDNGHDFVKCLHSVGYPLNLGDIDPLWPCAPMEKKYITQFPEEKMIWSYGSGYGGNALLGKKAFALRIASAIAKDEGWLAEHMLILKLTSPEGEVKYITGAFPSACGKTNLAMINPTLEGWKAETLGDDIAWLKIHEDGLMYAINPEAGFFGVTSGTSYKTNPIAMETVAHDTIFTNVALTDDYDVWWEGMASPPKHLIDWRGNDWYDYMETRPDHPNARFTASLTNCPSLAENYETPVPISAILFGGRRPSTIPLVHQSFDFEHGIFIGSIMGSEITAAAIDENIGKVRRDPFAMLPFIGYNIADYIKHWQSISRQSTETKLPKIFFINWFQKENNKFIWPGFGENIRVLKWIFERTDSIHNHQETPIGFIPNIDRFDFSGLRSNLDKAKLFEVSKDDWQVEIDSITKYFYDLFGEEVPLILKEQLHKLVTRFN